VHECCLPGVHPTRCTDLLRTRRQLFQKLHPATLYLQQRCQRGGTAQ
jgi:hypothetical protein